MTSGASKYWEEQEEERLAKIEAAKNFRASGGLLLHHDFATHQAQYEGGRVGKK